MRTRLSALSVSGAIATLFSLLWRLLPSARSRVGNKADGQTKAAVCAACHGPKGISVNPLWPSLAGQQEAYLAKQIKEFRDGVRVEATMQPFVANLTDQDVARPGGLLRVVVAPVLDGLRRSRGFCGGGVQRPSSPMVDGDASQIGALEAADHPPSQQFLDVYKPRVHGLSTGGITVHFGY